MFVLARCSPRSEHIIAQTAASSKDNSEPVRRTSQGHPSQVTSRQMERNRESETARERVRGPFLTFPADWSDMSAGEAGQTH